METPPLAIKIPDKTNIGIASNGKESIPPSIERMMYSPFTGKFGSSKEGNKELILKPAEIGTERRSKTTNKSMIHKAIIVLSPFFFV